MDLYFQGMACANKGTTPEFMGQARGFFERSLALDSGNIEALIGTAFVDTTSAIWLLTDDRTARLAAAEAALTRVLSLAPNHAMAHYLFGAVQISSNRAVQGIPECERALALDRNLAAAHGWIGMAKYFIGRSEETEAHVQEALRLSPIDTNAYLWMNFAGFAKLCSWRRRGRGHFGCVAPSRPTGMPRLTHFGLAIALAHLGRLE